MRQITLSKYRSTYIAMFWLMLHDLIFVVCSLVDISCANMISGDAVIAVSVACSVHSLMFSLHKIFARSLRVIASRLYGAKDDAGERSVTSLSLIFSVAVAIVVGTVVLVFGTNILGWFSMTDTQIDLAYSYLQYRTVGYFIYAFANPLIRQQEARGKTGAVTRLRLINLINVPVSLLLAPIMGVAGIGLGTTIAETSEFILLLIVFKPKLGKPDMKYAPELLKLSLSYVPECIFNMLINNFAINMCLTYLDSSIMVISELVNNLYNNIVDVIYMTTQQAEITIGREYGAKNQAGIADEFQKFKHCYMVILLWHIPVTMLLGWIYLGFITPVSDLTFALVLLAVRMLSASVYYVGLPAMRILYIFGVVRPVMLTRLFGLCIMQLLVQWISLELGADTFCIPISYFAADFIWGIMNVWLIRKHKFLKTSSIIMEVNT